MGGLRIRGVRTAKRDLSTRIPFHFGIAELRHMPHLFLSVTLEQDGRTGTGIAADHLLPKWFTKNPATSYEEDIGELGEVVAVAIEVAVQARPEPTPFRLWWEIYHEMHRRAAAKDWPPLLASFGATLIERALIDAFCRMQGKPFSAALRGNELGIELGRIHPELAGRAPAEFLPAQPLTRIGVRHTVGIGAPLTPGDFQFGEVPDDGLPVSLEACIARYGLSLFKIKIGADTAANLSRLREVVAVLDRAAPGDYRCTLDGNESYRSVAEFRRFWDELLREPALARWMDRLLFVEQPLHRDVALQDGIREAFRDCARPPRLIIDESDAALDSLPLALERGYEGTSHKNCKGVFKSVANLALLKHRARPYLFTGEDLTNIGPVALLEDVCVAANLGIESLERNGHHFFRGLAAFSPALRKSVLEAHPDLFGEMADGCPTMRIEEGFISCGSLQHEGLGLAFDLDAVFS